MLQLHVVRILFIAIAQASVGLAVLLQPQLSFANFVSMFGESDASYPDGTKQVVELLRFITPFKTGLETLVDITPYSPLLRAVANSQLASSLMQNASTKSALSFYASADTWARDTKGERTVSLEEVHRHPGQCKARLHKVESAGEGWGVTANLVFWPRVKSSNVSPSSRHTVTLASGRLGSMYPIGKIDVLEGEVMGDRVQLSQPTDLAEADEVACFVCEQGAQTLNTAKALAAYQDEIDGASAANKNKVAQKAFEDQVRQHMGSITPTAVNNETRTVTATYDSTNMMLKPGMHIYGQLEDGQATSLAAMGQIISVGSEGDAISRRLDIQMNQDACLPRDVNTTQEYDDDSIWDFQFSLLDVSQSRNWWPRLSAMVHPDAMASAQSFALRLNHSSISTSRTKSGSSFIQKLSHDGHLDNGLEKQLKLLHYANDSIVPLPFLGKLALRNTSDKPQALLEFGHRGSSEVQHGQKVCAVRKSNSGRFFRRDFDLPALKSGERVLAHLTITGHGWERTLDKCGEFCEAQYHVAFNDGAMVNLSQFRTDCKVNPLGDSQHGTWRFDRNGWCPGSVSSGSYFDVTELLKSNEELAVANTATIDVSVKSSKTKKFGPYVDFDGWRQSDTSLLATSFNLFVYDAAAVQEIVGRDRALTAAEQALRVHTPEDAVKADVDSSLLERVGKLSESTDQMDNIRVQGQQEYAAFGAQMGSPIQPLTSPRGRHFKVQGDGTFVQERSGDGEIDSSFLMQGQQESASSSQKLTTGKRRVGGEHATGAWNSENGLVDFKSHAPWYLTSASGTQTATEKAGVVRVPLFKQAYLNAWQQTATTEVESLEDMPEDWEQVALEFKLHEPPEDGYSFDHWDRLGSLGIMFHDDTPGVELHPHAPNGAFAPLTYALQKASDAARRNTKRGRTSGSLLENHRVDLGLGLK